ncbi:MULTISPECIES: thiamine phosphate synthase [Chryseobacterium]|uniref:thiamine phosphate synthase n=1 Tax=Chryseobacterium TaxID=59732 RepID=UPI000E71B8BC|nr:MULTISPECIES: thiamine phosphate synthase [Chryseobacterium]MDH5036461.1 thiamine phosphate synthase [Chryseobacterium cucumeris]QWT85085.1 thiamine phosphate synthase [Chryseobacterium sp. PCH239]RKE75746.1 thiamine-phosphate pyrophosphorylase [Chryseobacterium sp. AG363]
MILVITPELIVPNETDFINQMFQEGLDLLHIRKPWISRNEMIEFITQIDESFYTQLVLHTYYDLGKEFTISRFHFREIDRQEEMYKSFAKENTISTSVHDIKTYNTLEKEWEYAFISPFFPSISKKGYGLNSTIKEEIKHRNNPDVKLIALGGIHQDNIHEVFDSDADGAALLGAIWESEEPLKVFKKCRNVLMS